MLSKNLFNLNELKINNLYNLSDESIKLISINLNKLNKLFLTNNNISSKGAIYITENLFNLTHLDLGNNKIQNEGASSIGRRLNSLVYLNIINNNLNSYDPIIEISKNLEKLIFLKIDENNLKNSVFETLCEGKLNLLRELSFANNYINENAFSKPLKIFENLFHIDLSGNKIGVYGVRMISVYLSNLISLFLDSNEIGDSGVYEICKNLGKYNNLEILSLNDNNISGEGAILIGESFKGLNKLATLENNLYSDSICIMLNNLKNISEFHIEPQRLNDTLRFKYREVLKY